jgi:hypothetical protein
MPRANIAIDLETLSTNPNAIILSIGACAICASTGEERKFYTGVDVSSQADSRESRSTQLWWRSQSADARKAYDYAYNGEAPSIQEALKALTCWLVDLNETHDCYLWGNGATFDISILEYAFATYSSSPPWNFRKIRDMRTLYEITDLFSLGSTIKQSVQRFGVHHNALDDACYQADLVHTSLKLLGGLAKAAREKETSQ